MVDEDRMADDMEYAEELRRERMARFVDEDGNPLLESEKDMELFAAYEDAIADLADAWLDTSEEE